MTSLYAKILLDKPEHMAVLFVVYPNIVVLDLVGPLQIFTHARKGPLSDPACHTSIVSGSGGHIGSNTILPVDSDPLEKWLLKPKSSPIHTLVVVGSGGVIEAALDRLFVEQGKQRADRSVRVCSVCSDALVIAAAGLLDGRRAVTHWEDCGQLAREYPTIKVEPDPICIKDGNIGCLRALIWLKSMACIREIAHVDTQKLWVHHQQGPSSLSKSMRHANFLWRPTKT